PPERGEPLIAYAVKANSNLSVLATLARLGAGADTVSEGEIRGALKAGVAPGKVVFSGVGKTEGEIAFALEAGILQINVESEPELRAVDALARDKGIAAPVAIRVNPDVEAGGHAKISTGSASSKFGVPEREALALYAWASTRPSLGPMGLACHIGSQITSLAPFEAAFSKMRRLALAVRAEGLAVERLDLGGGLGVPYFDAPNPPTPADYARVAAEAMKGLDLALIFEPGRVIAANAGVLLTRVIRIKRRADGRRIIIVDAAMNDLIRPAMYEAWHDIRPAARRKGAAEPCDVAGPVCESADVFARDRPLPPLQRGDLLALMTAGAYGAVMASEYNGRPLVPEVLVQEDAFAIVRGRPSLEAMLERDRLAPWLASGPVPAPAEEC
ncbi:MAG: diaminopimelate decarboxylase, partial [Caulobacteraceae bacterium]